MQQLDVKRLFTLTAVLFLILVFAAFGRSRRSHYTGPTHLSFPGERL